MHVGLSTLVCPYGGLTHAWVLAFIEVFRSAIEQVNYCNMGES